MINTIVEFIKKELTGWKKTEIIGISFIFAIIIINAFVLNDSKIAIISAFCGMMYTIIAGKGKISCYLFGLMGSGFYSYLAFKNGLYGNVALYMGYYIPMQICGIFQWKKHLKKETNEIFKTKLSAKECISVLLVSSVLCAISIFILYYIEDTHPVIDGIVTSLSLAGMYLTVKRSIEQWIVWGAVNLLSLIMWILVIITGVKVYSTALMWFVYLILAVYFYIEWNKELSTKNI